MAAPKEFPTSAAGYEVVSQIGMGAFATVWRARVKGAAVDVAIKILDLNQLNPNWDEIRKEIATMRLLEHVNVVKIYQSFVEDAEIWIVMPLLTGGSCAAIMKTMHPNGFKDEALLATILREALKGLEYLHSDNKIHRDVKAGNILISGTGEVQIADFGVAGSLVEDGNRKENRRTFTGTPCWMAPEVMEQSDGYDLKADIWSFGITAMELAYGRAPYAKYQPMKVLLLTLQEAPPTPAIYKDSTSKFGKSYNDLVSRCLQKDSSKRPTVAKLLTHPFFKKAKDAAYIEATLVRNLPPPEENKASAAAFKERRKTKDPEAAAVPVGSWVFDDEDLKQLRAGKKTEILPVKEKLKKSRFEVQEMNDGEG